jgi:rod shape-determining protein MreC
LQTVIKDTLRKQQYTYITARVINNSVNRRNNYLTLDKGSLQGIEKDMGVISSSGVVGIVKDVSKHYCTVMSVLHKNTRISARFNHNNYFGSPVWDGNDSREATLLDIAKHVKFSVGDTLVTTVFSSIFPEGVMVGVVKESNIKKGDNFYKITVNLSANFLNLSHVYIVNNLLKKEQQELEAGTGGNDDN